MGNGLKNMSFCLPHLPYCALNDAHFFTVSHLIESGA